MALFCVLGEGLLWPLFGVFLAQKHLNFDHFVVRPVASNYRPRLSNSDFYSYRKPVLIKRDGHEAYCLIIRTEPIRTDCQHLHRSHPGLIFHSWGRGRDDLWILRLRQDANFVVSTLRWRLQNRHWNLTVSASLSQSALSYSYSLNRF